MEIINLTQHAATGDQIAAGVFEPADIRKIVLRAMRAHGRTGCFDDL